MGQKTNPIGNRLGIIRGWESNWYGGNDYGDKLAEDQKLRNYVFARLSKASVSRVIIERRLLNPPDFSFLTVRWKCAPYSHLHTHTHIL